MISRDQAFALLDMALGAVTAESASAWLSGNLFGSTRIADNVATQCLRREDVSLHVTCAHGQQHASASTNDLGPEAVREVVRRAQEAARLSPPDPEFMPPLPAEEATRYPQIDDWCQATADLAPEHAPSELEQGIDEVRRAGHRLSGAYTHSAGLSAFANSNGLKGYHRSTEASVRATVLAGDGSGWAQSTATSAGSVDVTAVVREALQIALDSRNPTDIEPGKYTVILRPAAVQEMLPWYMVCDAKATDEGRTFLRGKFGQKVCSERISLRSEPLDPRCPGSPFVGDGLAAEPICWVRQGVLENLCRSRYWAQKTGLPPSRGPTNLILDGGEASLQDLIASTDRGILVTRFWYIRVVDPMTSLLTGMTRDGLFLIENGRVTRPLKQLRFNEKVLTALSNVEAFGRPERIEGCLVPTLKVREFTFSSATRF
jgi:predicted Zn-dependent protease